MNANVKFEIIADAFCRTTGMLAPGKDAWAGPSHEERRDAFAKWRDQNNTIINSMIHAVEHVYGEDRQDIRCPFCDEDDFDLVGLKHHLTQNYCAEYDKI